MNGQAKTIKPLREHIHNPLGIFLQFKANNKIIGKANQEASTLHAGFNIFHEPIIQYMMKE
jgi:hypothetical protein